MTILTSQVDAAADLTSVVVGTPRLHLVFDCAPDRPVALSHVRADHRDLFLGHAVPAVEVLTVGGGHAPATSRLTHTVTGAALRYAGHEVERTGPVTTLVVRQQALDGSVCADLHVRLHDEVAAVRAHVTITAGDAGVVLLGVPSLSMGLGSAGSAARPDPDWHLLSGRSDWLAEQRWGATRLHDLLPAFAEDLTGHDPRDAWTAASTGTWSTGGQLPVGVLVSEPHATAWAWQIEHNGPWVHEVGRDTAGWSLTLSGPTERHAGWSKVLAPGESFDTVPVSVAVGIGLTGAVGELTRHRRVTRRPHPDNVALGVVFNDYMNTLDGDPTTEKLLPLIDAAAAAGAEYFCIDAGWYDDSGDWWPTVGEWRPSTTRFPGGMGEVVDRIRSRGMVPGLWLEPEVIGVGSPLANRLPDEAFLLRHGRRVVEHSRYHLDLRHRAARAHVDEVVERLVAEFGIGFFKFDYNIDPGTGTDHAADSPGDGLLGHHRAVLAWFDDLLDRHPDLVIEHCSSGAMRADPATLSRVAMQSTSDQQQPWLYPPIAAASPMSFLPEQSASWAYPQPGMTAEEIVFCLVTGLLGRFYLSGYLNRMAPHERELVAEAVAVAKRLRTELPHSLPYWPVGLPGWTDDVVALGLRVPGSDLVSIWLRDADEAELDVPHLRGRAVHVETVFPSTVRDSVPDWSSEWDPERGRLRVRAACRGHAARVLRLVPGSDQRADPRAPQPDQSRSGPSPRE